MSFTKVLLITLTLSLSLLSCKDQENNRGKPFYQRGVILENEKKFEEAEKAYLQCLVRSPQYSEVYYRLAFIYECYLAKPSLACHYYQLFLENGAFGQKEATAKEKITSLQQQELQRLLQSPIGKQFLSEQSYREKEITEENQLLHSQKDHLLEKLKITLLNNQRLQKEISSLNQKLTVAQHQLQQQETTKVINKIEEKVKPIEHNEIYVVKVGDNLGRISQKFYGTTQKWRLILEKNKEILRNSDKNLRPGMQLTIPAQNSDLENETPAG